MSQPELPLMYIIEECLGNAVRVLNMEILKHFLYHMICILIHN